MEQHREYFTWFSKIMAMGGGKSAARYIQGIKNAALQHLSNDREEALDNAINAPLPPDPYTALQARDFVKEWTVYELLPVVSTQMTGRNFEQDRQIYGEAMCMKCHRFNGRGGNTGPNLTGVGARYDNRSILEALLDPDKVIPDQYNTTAIYPKDATVYTGRISDIWDHSLVLSTDLFDPSALEFIPHSEIDKIRTFNVSTMPAGLLNVFTQENILDLVAFLKSQGNPDH